MPQFTLLKLFLLTETLDISGLLDVTGQGGLFAYANILLQALIPVALIGLGFALGKQILSFLQRIFSNLL